MLLHLADSGDQSGDRHCGQPLCTGLCLGAGAGQSGRAAGVLDVPGGRAVARPAYDGGHHARHLSADGGIELRVGWRTGGPGAFRLGAAVLRGRHVLVSAILARLRTGPALAPAVRGIIGIQLAPAFVGGNAWLAVNGGQVDVFLLLLVGYGLLQLAFLMRLLPWVLEGGYAMSLWGFSFGLAAMASVGMHLVVAGQLVALGWVLWWLGSGLVAALWVGLLWLAVRGRLLVR